MRADEFEDLCCQVHVAGWRLVETDAGSETAAFETEEGGRVSVRGARAVGQLIEMADARAYNPPLARAFLAAVRVHDALLAEEAIIGSRPTPTTPAEKQSALEEAEPVLREKGAALRAFQEAARPVAIIGKIALAERTNPDGTSGPPN